MKKYLKYLFIITLFVSSVSLFSGISGKTGIFFAQLNEIQPEPEDTIPRYPVKKTQITNYEDLKDNPPADLKTPSNIKTSVEYDPKTKLYIFRTKIGDQEIATPFSLTPDEYMDYSLKQSMSNYFRGKNTETYENKDVKEDFSLKDVKLNLGSADKLFGPGGVQVKTNGYVEAMMGIKHTSNDNPTISERNRKKTAFYFDEDIQMNVTASVGDKINFGMNYDTKALFDFDSKKLKLGYEGKEDEIIKHIEAGNVSMATTNSLINGGTSLFGINAGLQFGKLRINAVISQQEAESQTSSSKGGIQTNEYEFKSDQYDENRHFLIGYYFRNNYDGAMSKIPYVNSPVNITNIEVWVTNKRGDYSQSRNIVAFADIGETDVIKNTSKWSKTPGYRIPDNRANNLYSTIANSYPAARDITQITGLFNGYIESGLDYEKIESARLLTSSEYTFNTQLGYISLTSALQADEVLAVAYSYINKADGATYQVGDFASDIVDKYDAGNTKSGALFLKLLKPISLSPRSYTWDLMMKNIYKISDNSIQQDRFRLNISYQSDTIGTYINYLPEGNIKDELLLRVMNLDRLDSRNNEIPGNKGDGIFDFVEGYTVNSQNGRIIFPVIEPFGNHLRKKIGNNTIADKYVYDQLYDSTLTVARQIAEKNKFRISGSYRGSGTSNAEIDLNTTNVPQGSVRLTAGGATLTEGVDYIVDYISGKVTIINQNILDSDIPVQVSSEGRTLSMQRKTMLGLNLSYDISKDFNIGGTIMHFYEKPLTTKVQMGDESVKNTLWGLNTSYKTESLWLTNLVDKIPLVNATQPSQISFNAEFAHMIPGHYENKETGGYSYLDDFETSESRIDIKSPYAWTLASIPKEKYPASPPTGDDIIKYGENRAMLAWFMIDGLFTRKGSSLTPEHIKNDKTQLSNHFVREIEIQEIYPDKDRLVNESTTIPILNLSYYPDERGPYNLDTTKINTEGKFTDPKNKWAGITRKMDVRDFEASNVEYIEFWLMDPFVYNGTGIMPDNNGGELHINLGEISEDVLKDGKKFYENGLPVNDDPDAVESTVWGKVPKRQSTVYAFDDSAGPEAREKQDVGLNGLSVAEEREYPTYQKYVNGFSAQLSQETRDMMLNDDYSPLRAPAGDLYHFYRGDDYDQRQVGILDRYKYYNNTEGNSKSTAQSSGSYSTAARNVPDVEDIDQDNTLNETEAYFKYKIDLKPTKMDVGNNFIVDKQVRKVKLRNDETSEITWYQFKIPVRTKEKEGNIQDLKSIRFMRMYLTDFEQTTHLRFGTLQLVRGDWRVYEQTLNKDNGASGSGKLDVSTVNVEENSKRKPVNYVLPPGISRMTDPDQVQMIKENEQSLSMRVTDLDAGDARAIYKNTYYDLRRYKRMQMFTHAEALINDNNKLHKGDLTVFMRLGSDYKNNYYEYEIPLTVTPEGANDVNEVWPVDNMFDFPLELLKNVKLHRNREKRKVGSSISYSTLYYEYDPDKQSNRVSVIGNPSLSDINVVMIGVRNNTAIVKSGEVWINELRLTDFDEDGGWAAQGNLNVALSDLGTINLSGRKETVGFGALDQSLHERRMDDYHTYSIAAGLELGKFFPEKAKVSLPVYYSYSNQTTTPEYDPFDQDVTLKEALSLVETKSEKDSIKSLAQKKTTIKSITFNNVKVNIQSKTPMPYDPANFSMGYSYSQSEVKNPTTVYDLSKTYKATFNYIYTPLVKTWEPFKKTKSRSGAAKFAKSIGVNYMPSNIAFNSNINRFYTETVLRDLESYSLGGANNAQFLSFSHSFLWDRDFNLNWDFTRNLKFTFQSGTRAEIEEPYLQVNKKANRDHYEIWKDEVIRSLKHLGNPLSYRQVARITYQLPFKSIPAMDWVTSNAAYNSSYEWDRGAKVEGLEVGNTISNNITLESTNRLNLKSLYSKWEFLKKVNERFDGKKRPQSPSQREREKKKPEKRKFTTEIALQKDGKTTIKHSLNTKNIQVTAKQDGKSYAIKFKKVDENSILITNKDSVNIQLNIEGKSKDAGTGGSQTWRDIAEYSARGLMSVRNIGFNYSRRNETHISGFRPGVGDAFGQKGSEYGTVPGLGFAFGFDGGDDFINKSYKNDWLVTDSMNSSPAIYSSAEKFEFRAQIEPFKGFKIELNANHEQSKRTETLFTENGIRNTYGGSFSMTTVALATSLRGSNAGQNYHSKAFDTFLKNRNVIKNRLESKYSKTSYPHGGFMGEPGNISLQGNPYSPGSINPNSPDVLVPAFIAAYTGTSSDNIALTALPSLLSMLPNWTLSYDGLSNIPFLKEYFKNIRINHGYTCIYQVSNYNSFPNWMESDIDGLGFIRGDALEGNPVASSVYNIGSVGISEMFNPLFGVEGTLNNNMTINTRYNNARTLTLNIPAYQIIESMQKEFVVGVAYRIDEFNRLIGLNSKGASKQFNNDLNIKADLSHKTIEALLRKIQENFTQATSGSTVVTLKISADYTMSRSLTLRAFYDRILNKPLISSSSYPSTNGNFGISLKFTLLQ